jgi:hypothetical protein
VRAFKVRPVVCLDEHPAEGLEGNVRARRTGGNRPRTRSLGKSRTAASNTSAGSRPSSWATW